MIKLYQKKWFGISFYDLGIPLYSSKIADEEFYKLFYKKFSYDYKSFEQLPHNWRLIKNEIAQHIITFLDEGYSVLSVGSGICYIENYLLNEVKSVNITAVEPNILPGFIDDNLRLNCIQDYFPKGLGGVDNYNFVYTSSVDYVFNDDEYISYFKSFIDYGFKDLLITEIFYDNNSFSQNFKLMFKHLLSFIKLYDMGQFWGYLRTLNEHLYLLKSCGYTKFSHGFYNHGAGWIKASV